MSSEIGFSALLEYSWRIYFTSLIVTHDGRETVLVALDLTYKIYNFIPIILEKIQLKEVSLQYFRLNFYSNEIRGYIPPCFFIAR